METELQSFIYFSHGFTKTKYLFRHQYIKVASINQTTMKYTILAIIIVLVIILCYAEWFAAHSLMTAVTCTGLVCIGIHYEESISGNEKITQGGNGADVHTSIVTDAAFRTILRNSKHLLRTTVSTSASVASAGMGGDVLVEVLILTLDAAAYLAQIMALQNAETWSNLGRLFTMGFEGGPDKVAIHSQKLLDELTPSAQANLVTIARLSIEQIAGMVGQIISAFIPNDGASASWITTEVIVGLTSETAMVASRAPYQTISGIYSNMPAAVRTLLENPEQLRTTLLWLLGVIRETLFSPNQGWTDTIRKSAGRFVAAAGTAHVGTIVATTAGLLIPGSGLILIPALVASVASQHIANTALTMGYGHKQLAEFIDKFVVPQIDNLVKLVHIVLPLAFSIVYILEKSAGDTRYPVEAKAPTPDTQTTPNTTTPIVASN
jgi:hypothetical protein